MSQADVENLRVWWEKFNRGEFDPSLLDPDVVYEDANLPDHIREAYRGHEGVRRATERWLEPFESLTAELERIVGTGDRLVSIHQVTAKARHTGIEFEGPLAYAYRFRDGKIVHFQSFRSAEEALEAAGISE
jgi:ketosteroid isomerase-like protein